MKNKNIIITILGIFFIVILAVTDHITGYEISFSIFYLIPILACGWLGTRTSAVIISVLSALAWGTADMTSGHRYSSSLVPVWNATMRLGMFLITAYFATGFKKELNIEKSLSRTDVLTGILNARYFYELADIERSRAVRFNRPLTIAYVDIDNFKQVNDDLGHSAGDDLLRSIAKTIKQSTRSYDIVARLGGDEFAILFPETSEQQATATVERIQTHLLDVVRKHAKFVTFSIGVVTYNKLAYTINEIIKEADESMYSVKKKGKNAITYKVVS